MDVFESLKMAVATLTANKLRSGLTMLGMIIGNAAVIATVGVGQGAQTYAIEQLESFGANRLFVFIGFEDVEGLTANVPQLTLSDAEAIATQAPAVKAVAPEITSNLTLTYQSRNAKATMRGTTAGILTVQNLAVARGRFFNTSEQQQSAQVVVLGSAIAQKLFGFQSPLGEDVQVSNLSLQVIGVMQAKGSFAGENPDEAAYLPITTMAEQITGRRSAYGIPVDMLQLSARDRPSIRAAAFQVTNLLTQKRGKKDFTVVANQSFNNLVSQVAVVLTLMLAAIAGISLAVGGIGIMNIMLVSVTERTGEIGLRKAIGASQQDILVQFIIEAVILSAAGGLIGAVLGSGAVLLVGAFSPLKPVLSAPAIVLAVGVSGSIGLFFGVVPAQQAAKLDPIVALRSA